MKFECQGRLLKLTFLLSLKNGNDGNPLVFTTLCLLICCSLMFHAVLCVTFVSLDQMLNAWGQGLFLFCISPSPPISSPTSEITTAAQLSFVIQLAQPSPGARPSQAIRSGLFISLVAKLMAYFLCLSSSSSEDI